MSTTSDDIERLLQTIESRRVRCPNCGSTDAGVCTPYYRLHAARFEMDGTVLLGYSDDDTSIPDVPAKAVCHACKHEWPLPADTNIVYGEGVECECEEAARLRRKALAQAFSDTGEARCGACHEQVRYTDAEDRWFHVDNNEYKCPVVGAKTYLRPPPIPDPGPEAVTPTE